MIALPESIQASSTLGALLWRPAAGTQALSSAPVGGGRSEPLWVLNVRVAKDYDRVDLAAHSEEVAASVGCAGPGIALFTAALIDRSIRGEAEGVVVDCTSGISKPTFAASPDSGWSSWEPGTINIVASVAHPLTEAAAVNAVMTITEAKSQALADLGVPGTGTASDAVAVLWPDGPNPERFCGPRSFVGSRLANAAFDAVRSTSISSTAGLEQ